MKEKLEKNWRPKQFCFRHVVTQIMLLAMIFMDAHALHSVHR